VNNLKITSLEKLIKVVTVYKKNKKKIVFTNGCFDIIHVGHVRYLEEAKSKGDFLILAVNDDLSIKNLKGHNRPINPLAYRLEVLAALESVDHVISFDEDTPETLLKLIKPHVLVKGGDYKNTDEIVGKSIVESYGGSVQILNQVKGISTSSIIKKSIRLQGQ
jgi:rfaE bifunctional protein nucleotidyltransferase chain/domain